MFPNRLASDTTSALKEGTKTPSMSPGLVNSITSLPPQLRILFDELPEHPPSATLDPDAAFNLHTLLTSLDPLIATRWHWKDTRKVLRSLNIVKESGRRASELIAEQSTAHENTPRSLSLSPQSSSNESETT
jgi:tRNA dimethylallyltransferase